MAGAKRPVDADQLSVGRRLSTRTRPVGFRLPGAVTLRVEPSGLAARPPFAPVVPEVPVPATVGDVAAVGEVGDDLSPLHATPAIAISAARPTVISVCREWCIGVLRDPWEVRS